MRILFIGDIFGRPGRTIVKDRLPGIFPRDLLLSYRNRTEELRALANRDLLRLIAGNEEQEAERFGLLCGSRKGTRRS